MLTSFRHRRSRLNVGFPRFLAENAILRSMAVASIGFVSSNPPLFIFQRARRLARTSTREEIGFVPHDLHPAAGGLRGSQSGWKKIRSSHYPGALRAGAHQCAARLVFKLQMGKRICDCDFSRCAFVRTKAQRSLYEWPAPQKLYQRK
jgi:hypothetical protein